MSYYSNPDGVSVHDGFPNPAADTSLQSIDLNALLVNHTASTYFMRIGGNEWARQGIFAGDLAIIDRSLGPKPNDPVVWVHEDVFVISPRHKLPENAEMWGTVTAVVHQYRGKA
ncbi:MAG TPA: S24 family peptidase [Candidatus Saccharimonadales bacterium]|nr:S24 family peptidase [Candidatus Saccharimonadales bacterium]